MSRKEDTQICTTCRAVNSIYRDTCEQCHNLLEPSNEAVAMPSYSDTTYSESEKGSSLFPPMSDAVGNISSEETRSVPPNDYLPPAAEDSRSFLPERKTFESP